MKKKVKRIKKKPCKNSRYRATDPHQKVQKEYGETLPLLPKDIRTRLVVYVRGDDDLSVAKIDVYGYSHKRDMTSRDNMTIIEEMARRFKMPINKKAIEANMKV